MGKTETAAYATERAKYQTTPQVLVRFFHVPDQASATQWPFSQDFSSGAITGATKPGPQAIESVRGNTQTVVPQEGRSSAGNLAVSLVDLAGGILKYISAPAQTVQQAMTPAVPGAGSLMFVSDVTGLPDAPGTVEVTTGTAIERVRYDLLDATNNSIRVSGRGVDGTTAASHGVGDAVTNGEQIRQGQRAKLYLGYDAIAETDFMAFGQWEVVGRRAVGAAWEIQLADLQLKIVKTVFLSATPKAQITARGNPITLLLQFLLSTGTAGNGIYDKFAAENSLGLPQAFVDITAFERLRDPASILAGGTGDFERDTFSFSITAPADAKTFLEENFYKAMGCYPFMTQDGKYAIKKYRVAQAAADVATLLDEDDILDFGGPTDGPVINQIFAEWDFDLPSLAGVFGIRVEHTATDSIKRFGRQPPWRLRAQGLRTSDGAEQFALRLARDIGRRFGTTLAPPILKLSTTYRRHTLDIGDSVKITHSLIPNPLKGTRGVTNGVFEVLDITPDFLADGRLALTLIYTGALPAIASTAVVSQGLKKLGFGRPPAPSGLEITGQANDTVWTGRDVKLSWRLQQTIQDQAFGAALPREPVEIRDYLVEVLIAGTVKRTEVAARNEYIYTWEKNVEDNGTAQRAVTFRVRTRSIDNNISESFAELAVSNPAPSMLNFSPTLVSSAGAAVLDWSGWQAPADVERFDILADTTSPPTTLVGFLDGGTRTASKANLTPGTLYYLRMVPYDIFGAGTPSNVISITIAAMNETTQSIGAPAQVAGLGHLDTPLGTGLSWTAVTGPDISYEIWESSDGEFGTYALLGKTPGTYFERNLNAPVSTWYKVRAVRPYGPAGAFSIVAAAGHSGIQTSHIADGQVMSADLGANAVTRLKILDKEVSDVAQITAADFLFDGDSVFRVATSLTVTVTGGRVIVIGVTTLYNQNAVARTSGMRITRTGGPTGANRYATLDGAGSQQNTVVGIELDTPAAGTYTYNLEVSSNGGGTNTISARAPQLVAMELKR